MDTDERREVIRPLLEEQDQLCSRLSRLESMIKSDKFKSLSEIHRCLLRAQRKSMRSYSQTLAIRMELLTKE